MVDHNLDHNQSEVELLRRKVLPTDTDAGARTTFSSSIRILALEDMETESSSIQKNDRSP